MKNVVLDFSKCNYIGELHEVIRNELGFPNYYGANLDALWDCLVEYCDYPLTIEIRGLLRFSAKSKEDADYVTKIMEVFSDVHDDTPNIIFKYNS